MKINKIKIIKLPTIKNKLGDILKFISTKNKYFKEFGEIYFSEIKKNKIKGWNYHKKYYCFISVPVGKVKFTICKNLKQKIKKSYIIGKSNYKMIIIPPQFYFCFTSLVDTSLIANMLNKPHSKRESIKFLIKNV
jgi:dTDP-4-dehydrorhamnose 3,5-epimerase-like enzyme